MGPITMQKNHNPPAIAKEKGRKARQEGKPATACPYQPGGIMSFSEKFRKSWLAGWHEVDNQKENL